MRSTFIDIITALWPLLPQITIGLRFITALIGLVLTLGALARRIRRRRRRSRR